MGDLPASEKAGSQPSRFGPVEAGVHRTIGSDFTSLRFGETAFKHDSDPISMLDHFVMTGPTFAPHLHQRISTVTALFEDSRGGLLNRDNIGASVDLQAGDLYRLAAGSGAVHEQNPSAGARIHALQIFVKLPGAMHRGPPRTFHVRSADVPVDAGEGYRVRTVLGAHSHDGSSGGAEMTLLDCSLQPGGQFTHGLPSARKAWVYVISGQLRIRSADGASMLEAGQMTTVGAGQAIDVSLHAAMTTHFILIDAEPLRSALAHSPATPSMKEAP